MEAEKTPFNQWCILELMGHRRLAGRVTEAEIAGKSFLRLDVPHKEGDGYTTQFYAPDSVYAITPTTEDVVRRARVDSVEPVKPWEFRQLPEPKPDPEPEGIHETTCMTGWATRTTTRTINPRSR